ncbi:MAG: hypothetical protein GXX90_04490 [Microbacteriaceae bacterium]|nr:hypothetical protein [Microbacteriaceae bacterium]
MRFILSVLAAVAGLVMLVVGALQFAEASKVTSITASGTTSSGAPLVVVTGETLASHAGTQHIEIGGDGRITVAVGREDDVAAWIGDTRHDRVAVDTAAIDDGREPLAFSPAGAEESAPDPAVSDLWIEVREGEGALSFDTVVAPGYSMLIASDGTEPAPPALSVTWPHGGYAPWSGPLLVAGALALLIAGGLLAWALLHRRRVRRDAEFMPVDPEPALEPLAEPADDGVDEPETWSAVTWIDVDDTPELDVTTPFEPEHDDDEPLHTDMITLPTAEERRAAAEAAGAEDAGREPDTEVPEPLDETWAPANGVAAGAETGARADLEAAVVAPEDAADAPTVDAEPVATEPVVAEDAWAAPAEPAPAEAAPAEAVDARAVEAEPEPTAEPEREPFVEPEPAAEPEPTAETAQAAETEQAAPAPADDDESKWRRPRGRNRASAPKRTFFMAPIALAGALVLAGCAPQYWPQSWTGADVAPTGTPTSTADAAILDEGADLPALTDEKVAEIIADAGEVAATADEQRETDGLDARFAGDALAERAALYEAQRADGELAGPVPFPTGAPVYVVPAATDEWPRVVVAVVEATADGASSSAPFAVTLQQETPRDPYRVHSLVQLAPGVTLP